MKNYWDNTEVFFLKNGLIPEGRTVEACRQYCYKNGIKWQGIKKIRSIRNMIDKHSATVLSAIEKCPPDFECGIAKKPAWNISHAADMLGVCVQTLRNWVKKAKCGEFQIPFYQKTENSPIYFPIRELVAWDEKKGEKA